MPSKNEIALSIVIPIYNEEPNLRELYRRLINTLNNLYPQGKEDSLSYEILLVDDGSNDRSWTIINELNETDKNVRGLCLSRNFGHQVAISAGLDHATGASVLIMDGDLQDPPEEIPNFLSKLEEGYDLVFGIRSKRADSITRKLFSWFFWLIFKTFLKVDVTSNQSIMRIMNRRFLESFRRFNEKNRFLAGLFALTGYRQATIPISHDARYAGESKFNLWKMIKLTFNAITSFSHFPLQIAGFTGLAMALLSFMVGLILIFSKLLYKIDVEGWASMMIAILFMGGVQLAFLGLIGEYIGRIFTEVQDRPLYIIKDKI
jgi:polyisoprenyl-phosphate glycosyltransferase